MILNVVASIIPMLYILCILPYSLTYIVRMLTVQDEILTPD